MIQKKILIETLKKGIEAGDWSVAEADQLKLIDYIEQLHKWNLVHNLTAVREPLEMVKRHLLDSLVLLPYLSNQSVLDVGTGAGLPGIPLAICRPDCSWVLLDSNQKKINFVQHMVLSLALNNVTAVCARVEAYRPESLFDLVVSRAFSSLAEFIKVGGPLCKTEGRLVAMKGADIDPSEIAECPKNCSIESIQPVFVPELAVKRSLVFIKMQHSESKEQSRE